LAGSRRIFSVLLSFEKSFASGGNTLIRTRHNPEKDPAKGPLTGPARVKTQKAHTPIHPAIKTVFVLTIVFTPIFLFFLIISDAFSIKKGFYAGRVLTGPLTSKREAKKGDTLSSILNELKVPEQDIGLVVKEISSFHDLRNVSVGDSVRVTRISGDIKKIDYQNDALSGVSVFRADTGWVSEKFEIPSVVGQTVANGVIETSLYEAGISAGIDPKIVMELSDIFAWDVDFATDIRKGDTFSILYETVYADDTPVRSGNILGAEVVNDGERYVAVYYKDKSGRADYYDLDGRTLRRSLLKSPLRYRRISSYFTGRRFHPILKRYRPHHGIDYAAPSGTPVEAAGEGRVAFSGWKSGYGNFILVNHNSIYATGYGHLRGIKKGIRPGRHVSQGEVIGYVGSTGISTGPHLHYEVRKRGSLVNPLSIKAEPRKKLGGNDLMAFMALKEGVLARLSQKNTVVAMKEDRGAATR